MNKTNIYPIIVISGTNASGKSSLGIELAIKYRGEIISADSRQVFRNFDLCCGKVSIEEKKMVPHHMIDICDIGDPFSVADYKNLVNDLIPQIIERGNIPFIVGGTGLYIDAVIKGYEFSDEAIDSDYRSALNEKSIIELQAMLSPKAYKLLKKNNSDFNNKRRLIRIIEKEKCGNTILPNNNPVSNVLQLGITWPKEILYNRIDERLSMRIKEGMVEEVRDYLANGGSFDCLYNLGLEYRYIAWYIEGKYSSVDELSVALSQAIKKFAKQQMKWFKRNPDIHWIDMSKNYYSTCCSLINSFLAY